MRQASHIFPILLALLVSRAVADEPRLAAPTGADETKLRQAVRAQYSDMYAATDRAGQMALAKQLWQDSKDADTADQQYAMLCESRDATARAGNLASADLLCQAIVKKFDVTMPAMRAGMFEAGAANADDAYFTLICKTVDDALLADDFDPARRMLQTWSTALSLPHALKWESALPLRQHRFDLQSKVYPAIKPAIDLLRREPTNPDGSLALGLYTCLAKEDWTHGLRILARGSDKKLRQLAMAEFPKPNDSQMQIAIADGWTAQAARFNSDFALAMQLHAYDWYICALPNAVAVPDWTHVEQQLQKLIPLVGGQRHMTSLWFAVGDAMARRAYAVSRTVGGAAAFNPGDDIDQFMDVPREGGLLVGFHVGLAALGNRQIITYLQPIYLTPTGEQDGKGFGKEYSPLQTVHAPEGCAIGAVRASGGRELDSITVTYMKIVQDRLDPGDASTTSLIGGPGGMSANLDGHGTPIIGIIAPNKHGYVGIGLVYSQPVNDQ